MKVVDLLIQLFYSREGFFVGNYFLFGSFFQKAIYIKRKTMANKSPIN
jgi:hypothetical protein